MRVDPITIQSTNWHKDVNTGNAKNCNVQGRRMVQISLSNSNSNSNSAHDLLYQDQQKAMERRAMQEEELLLLHTSKTKTTIMKELKAPKLKIPKEISGTGFGNTSFSNKKKNKGRKKSITTPKERLAIEQAKILQRDGVLRMNDVLSSDLSDRLREYVLQQQTIASKETQQNPKLSKSFYGVENQRQNRCDLQLSLLQGGYASDRTTNKDGDGDSPADIDKDDDDDNDRQSKSHILADVLQELLGQDGTLGPIYEHLVTLDGEFYELASVITDPGSIRQQIHPDLPYQKEPPLYVIFVALQDINENMGPTTFLLKTHTSQQNELFNDYAQKDDQLRNADSRIATLQKGDAVLFDARILHCGNANDVNKGSVRALFNFSFRNPKVTGNLGYPGSIRPGYCGKMTLGDIKDVLTQHGKDGNFDSFAKYGDGLLN